MCVKSLKNMQSFQEKMRNITTYHCTLVRKAIIENLQINIEGGMKKREPSYTVGEESKPVQPPWRTGCRFFKKLKYRATI